MSTEAHDNSVYGLSQMLVWNPTASHKELT